MKFLKETMYIAGIILLSSTLYAQNKNNNNNNKPAQLEKAKQSASSQLEKAKKVVKETINPPVWVQSALGGKIIPVERKYFKFMKQKHNDEPIKVSANNSQKKPFRLGFTEPTIIILFDGFKHFAKGTLGEYVQELNDEDRFRLVAGVRISNAFYVEIALRRVMGDNEFNKYSDRCGKPCDYPTMRSTRY